MCSIAGFMVEGKEDRIFSQVLAACLLMEGSVRGDQSSGVFRGGRVFKRAVKPEDLIDDKRFAEVFRDKANITLLHTRFPTMGERGDNQAQPFVCNRTVSVHNGYYFNTKALRDTFGLNKASGVDSELVAEFVEGHGIKELPMFFETTSGPSAVAVSRKGRLWLMRNGNPTAYATVKYKGASYFVFASTREILEFSLQDVSDVIKVKIEFKVKTLEEHVLFEVVGGKLKEAGRMELPKAKIYKFYDDDDWNDDDRDCTNGVDDPECDNETFWNYLNSDKVN